MMQQERQLEEQRAVEERQRRLALFGRQLLSQLENLKLAQVTALAAHGSGKPPVKPAQGAVAFVGLVKDGRLESPWEADPRAQQFGKWLDEPGFARRLRQAQYAQAVDAARHPAQRAYARLLLAQSLAQAGRTAESRAQFERVLHSPPDQVDEHGVPLALYAAPRLLGAGVQRDEIRRAVRAAVGGGFWLPPAALYLARDLAKALPDPDLEAVLSPQIRDREQAEALQADFARLPAPSPARGPVWNAYGEPVWLVSLAASAGPASASAEGLAVAVRAREALAVVEPQARVVSHAPSEAQPASHAAGEALGENFPGLRVILPPAAAPSGPRRGVFLVFILTLALALTLLAAYLLWRDVQRDLQLADMRSQFVSSVTHELKTPLTAIRMFSETMRFDEEMDRPTQREYLDTILSESERLSRLVDNVLNFARIEQGKRIYAMKPVRLEEVVGEAARAIDYPLRQSGFALEMAVDAGLPAVEADRDALQQAILNLLANAMKYSGASRRIGLGLRRENGRALIGVVDHGIGIPPEEQARIFEQFYRVSTAENRHIPGAGLGLTLVAHIAQAHGGDVIVESRTGHGSAFTIRLPLPIESERSHGTHSGS